jgi:hypothetical protein
MWCKTYEQAKAQAFANAKQSGVPWVVFMDTSGNWRCERLSGAPEQISFICEPDGLGAES